MMYNSVSSWLSSDSSLPIASSSALRLISILVCLLPVFEKKSDDPSNIDLNPILKEFVTREDLYREKLLHLTNRGTIYRLDKCCKTINIMLSKEEIGNRYFNINDLDLLMDILLREATTNTNSKTRIQILKLMEVVLDNEIYREHKYRMEDVEEMVQECILYEEEESQEKKYGDAELECIATLN